MTHSHLPRAGRRTPLSTYRLQLGPDLSFDDAATTVPYLASLGVTDLYLSPVLQAAPGSTHGYDVVDHSRISAEAGGRAGLERLASAAHDAGLGVVVDVVPNHMSVPTPAWHNRALWSVLRDGESSPYARWFDVDLGDDILMPVLGDRIGAVLARGELSLEAVVVPTEPDLGEQPVLRYYDHAFPVREGTEQLPLAELLEAQHYRLAYWRVADEELNYRRFFDVGTLAAVRVEHPEVFDATHALLLELVRDGVVDALRVDHPDGLADPRGYFRRLHEATDGAWVVAEKILEGTERLSSDWPVAGTTGYDAAWRVGALQVDPAGAVPLGAVMHQLTGDQVGGLSGTIERAKRQIVETSLYAEVHRLATLLAELCHDDIRLRDHTFRSLMECVSELVVAIDRYRAYVVPGEPAPATAERVLAEAAEHARVRLEPDRYDTLDVVVDLLLGREVGSAGRMREARRAEAVVRFQQVCGAVMAKGVEDTAYYRWTHLVSLCEVGSDAHRFGIAPDDLHAWAGEMQQGWPATMTLGSSHDTKRGEDVRARINVLSQHADAWAELVERLREATERLRPADLDGRTENLLWQTLAGTWTQRGAIAVERFQGYLTKAAREQKSWTSWTAPEERREAELLRYAAGLLTEPAVVEGFTAWVARTEPTVRAAVLGTKLVQLTIPGVADVYQGTEITQTSLVDPDNRRPVAFGDLAARLEQLDRGEHAHDLDAEKLHLTATALRLRRRHPTAFVSERATYQPLPTSSGHAVAFARGTAEGPQAVTVATRLAEGLRQLGGFGEHTVVLPEGSWHELLGGARLAGGPCQLGELLAHRPVALLERAG